MNQMEKLAEKLNKSGNQVASMGSTVHKLNVIPTGVLSLDYALGTGGWPRGQLIEVFGKPDVGKTSVLGLGAIRNAQQLGLNCCIIALEPNFDPKWATKNGVNCDELLILRPDNGEDAFDLLHTVTNDGSVGFVLFDSIGAILKKSETDEHGKMTMGGQSNLITWGVKNVVMPAWKNNVCVMFLNQVRDNMSSHISGLVESPGGWALKHSAAIRVELKNLGTPIKVKYESQDVIVGREVVADIRRNKMHEGSNHRAAFTFYQMETDEYKVGVDHVADMLATGTRTGVLLKSGAWYSHPVFPQNASGEHKLQGRPAVESFVDANPKAMDQIRKDILSKVVSP